MPLAFQNVPESISECLARSLRESLWADGGAVLGVTDPRRLVCAAPHLAYSVPMQAVEARMLLSEAQPYAYRFLLLDGASVVGSADVGPVRGERIAQLYRVGTGRHDAATLTALRLAQHSPRTANDTFDVRWLTAPALYFGGVWLHGAVDWIIPVASLEAEFAEPAVQPVDIVTDVLAHRARSIRAANRFL